ncbi:uncharacterized protein AMSG_05456 [Thecamonas trahens ATCC 50062]|uniref:Uncharacterized protein n=1 Tax=Thecamonas trahens ATCC 50062 TaxID=461836 RepID=A0A0L0DAR3_THETB|nr:hypothetical protein AMSG_05456 [Thecamonas trahens ATCC 50062]KNC49449.1 hypothetical protein AMSG_05456 [Thecamonas trahens ATCC 50062]|eukprot:XP_013757869.1 hypothetical protein AMSG_05456 [Thecamonas trahens ATCC 50062]
MVKMMVLMVLMLPMVLMPAAGKESARMAYAQLAVLRAVLSPAPNQHPMDNTAVLVSSRHRHPTRASAQWSMQWSFLGFDTDDRDDKSTFDASDRAGLPSLAASLHVLPPTAQALFLSRSSLPPLPRDTSVLHVTIDGPGDVVLQLVRYDANVIPGDAGNLRVDPHPGPGGVVDVWWAAPRNLGHGEFTAHAFSAPLATNVSIETMLCRIGSLMDAQSALNAPQSLSLTSTLRLSDARYVSTFSGLPPGFHVLNMVLFSLVDGSRLALSPVVVFQPPPPAPMPALALAVLIPLVFFVCIFLIALFLRGLSVRAAGIPLASRGGMCAALCCCCASLFFRPSRTRWKYTLAFDAAVADQPELPPPPLVGPMFIPGSSRPSSIASAPLPMASSAPSHNPPPHSAYTYDPASSAGARTLPSSFAARFMATDNAFASPNAAHSSPALGLGGTTSRYFGSASSSLSASSSSHLSDDARRLLAHCAIVPPHLATPPRTDSTFLYASSTTSSSGVDDDDDIFGTTPP